MRRDAGLIGLVQAAVLLLVPPAGNFPLNDDWAYGHMVRDLLATGRLSVSDWATAAAVVPTWWGALFCLPFGFSHTALRISTLTLSFVGLLAFYGVLVDLGISRRRAVAGAVLLQLNPLYLNLSYSFMTDVSFVSFMLLALLFYLKGLRGDVASLWLGGAATAASLLCRQLGVFLCLAPVLVFVARRREHPWRWLHVCAVAAVPMAVFMLHSGWMAFVHGPTPGMLVRYQEQRAFMSNPVSLVVAGERLAWSVLYMGWFVAPLACAATLWRDLPVLHQASRLRRSVILLSAAGLLVLLISGLIANDRRFLLPHFENVIMPEGFGPSLAGAKPALFPAWIWPVLTLVSALAVIGLALNWRRASQVPAGVAMVLVAGFCIGVPTYVYVLFWDDYLLPFVPLAIAMTLHLLRRLSLSKARVLLGLAVMAFFSLASQQDYLAWRSAAWDAAGRLARQGVPLRQIDGGLEWNGWFLFQPGMTVMRARVIAGRDVEAWTAYLEPRYRLAFAPLSGSTIIDTAPYRVWLPSRDRAVFVLSASPDRHPR